MGVASGCARAGEHRWLQSNLAFAKGILTFAKGGDMDGILTSLREVTDGVRMVVVVDATLPWTERGGAGDLATSWWLERVVSNSWK